MQVVDKLSINYTFIFPVSKHLIIRYRVSPSELRLLSKSALRGRSIDNFIELWCLVASRGLEICISSTSFKKNDNGWPQQPLTERVSDISEKLDF